MTQKVIIVSTWDDYDKHRQDFQEAGHDCRTFGVGNVLCRKNPLYNHLICTPVPRTQEKFELPNWSASEFRLHSNKADGAIPINCAHQRLLGQGSDILLDLGHFKTILAPGGK